MRALDQPAIGAAAQLVGELLSPASRRLVQERRATIAGTLTGWGWTLARHQYGRLWEPCRGALDLCVEAGLAIDDALTDDRRLAKASSLAAIFSPLAEACEAGLLDVECTGGHALCVMQPEVEVEDGKLRRLTWASGRQFTFVDGVFSVPERLLASRAVCRRALQREADPEARLLIEAVLEARKERSLAAAVSPAELRRTIGAFPRSTLEGPVVVELDGVRVEHDGTQLRLGDRPAIAIRDAAWIVIRRRGRIVICTSVRRSRGSSSRSCARTCFRRPKRTLRAPAETRAPDSPARRSHEGRTSGLRPRRPSEPMERHTGRCFSPATHGDRPMKNETSAFLQSALPTEWRIGHRYDYAEEDVAGVRYVVTVPSGQRFEIDIEFELHSSSGATDVHIRILAVPSQDEWASPGTKPLHEIAFAAGEGPGSGGNLDLLSVVHTALELASGWLIETRKDSRQA